VLALHLLYVIGLCHGATTSTSEAEDITRTVCGFSEIEYERSTAAPPKLGSSSRLPQHTDDAV
jgi:hypothetical protein